MRGLGLGLIAMENCVDLDRLLLGAGPDLKAAVNATLDVRRAISAFRNKAVWVLDTGDLFRYVEAWYVEKFSLDSCDLKKYPTAFMNRNPYAEYRSKHPELDGRFKELDFLLVDVPREEEPKLVTPQCKLTAEEVEQLLTDLSEPDGKLAKLITVNPYITHEENLHIAVTDARLWLCNSELPVEEVLPWSPSYKAIRWDGAPAKRQLLNKPPSFYCLHNRHTAAGKHRSQLTHRGSVMYHLTPADFKDQGCHMARVARLGIVHSMFSKLDNREFATSLVEHRTKDDEAGAKDRFLAMLKAEESDFMFRALALRIYDEVPGESSGRVPA